MKPPHTPTFEHLQPEPDHIVGQNQGKVSLTYIEETDEKLELELCTCNSGKLYLLVNQQ